MFGIERLQAIRELIKEKKSVEVTYLSKELGVSEVTIRRDLDKLEKEGFVAKTYGGAILIDDGMGIMEKVTEPQRVLLGETSPYDCVTATAVKLISEGDTIFICGGDMGKALVKQLKEIEHLIVVTNNLEIAMYLYLSTNHKVVIIGGEVDQQSGNVLEYDQLDELLIEKSFISVEGIDMDFGYTVNEKSDVRLFKRLESSSRHVVLVAATGSFDKRGLVKLAPLDGIGTVVGEKDLPDAFKTYYYENNIKVHTTMLQKG